MMTKMQRVFGETCQRCVCSKYANLRQVFGLLRLYGMRKYPKCYLPLVAQAHIFVSMSVHNMLVLGDSETNSVDFVND